MFYYGIKFELRYYLNGQYFAGCIYITVYSAESKALFTCYLCLSIERYTPPDFANVILVVYTCCVIFIAE